MNLLGLWISLVLTSTATELRLARIVEGGEALPSLERVQAWASASMGLPSLEDVRGWATRARLRGLVPRLAGRLGSDANVYVKDSFSDWTTATSDRRGLAMRIEARFDLGELVFADQELRASREAIARAAAERLVLEEVTRIYFERVALYLERSDAPPADDLRAAALDGLLRAYTGGRYRLKVGRGRSR